MKKILFFFSACFLFSYLSCLKEEGIDFKYPRVYTDQISDITSNGARFVARIDFPDIDQVTDFGFIWGVDQQLSGTTFTLPSDAVNGNVFYTDVRSSLIDQKIYYVRSFVKKSGKTVYGNIVSFKSLGSEGPKITGLVPQIAAFNDTVRVMGKNFIGSAKLRFGTQDISSSIVKSEKSSITFVLPNSISIDPAEAIITVSIDGNIDKSPLPLKLDLDRILPKILSITPSTIRACDTVTIKGKNFIFGQFTSISNGLGALDLITVTNETIVCKVKILPKNELSFFVSNERFFSSSQGIDLIEQRPEIISVTPLIYKSNDIVTVKVKNFPYCDDSMYATINNYTRLAILSKSKDEMKLQLPEGCSGAFNIVFTFPAGYYLDTQEFATPFLSPEPPQVYSIEPSHGSFGDEIRIKGNNLKGTGVDMLDTISTSNTEIRGKLTQLGSVKDNGFTDVMLIGCGSVVKEDAFKYDPVEILDFNPKVITSRSQLITITGKNFSSAPFKNTITVGSYRVDLASDDNHTLIVPAGAFLPDITQSVHESISIIIRNNVGTQVTSSTPLQINCDASWSRLNDFPFFNGIYLGISFSVGGKGYVGGNEASANFWEYNPTNDVWQEKAPYPGPLGSYRVSTSASGKGYVGLHPDYYNEWWEYNPTIDTWNRKKDYPGLQPSVGFAFDLGGKVYVSSGRGDLWEYNPTTDSWSAKADLPPVLTGGGGSFAFKGKGYVYGSFTNGAPIESSYDPNTNTWATRPINNFARSGNNNCMVFQDYVIVGGESYENFNYNTFQKIVPGSGNFEVADYAGIYRKGQIGFAIDNYGYWGLGINTYYYQPSLEIWRFDPSKFQE